MKKYASFRILLLAGFLFCNANSCDQADSTSVNTGDANAAPLVHVRKVIDGDTFILDDTKKGTHVRIIGLDCPESRQTKYEDVQPYGAEAKQYLIDLLDGQEVRLEYDVEPKDKYGRTLAYVYLSDGRFVNLMILENGWARLNTVPPNVAHVDEFTKAQSEARRGRKGMWN
jgi:micrococcal nuclease